jgi:hypothetical protein
MVREAYLTGLPDLQAGRTLMVGNEKPQVGLGASRNPTHRSGLCRVTLTLTRQG